MKQIVCDRCALFLLDGFNLVFPLNTLAIFTPDELNQLISGDTSPNKWTYEELLTAFEPAAGYTRQSTGYLMLLEVLSNFTGLERKRFVTFVTGSPNLPPGGFRNLHPKIRVRTDFHVTKFGITTLKAVFVSGGEKGCRHLWTVSQREHLHALPKITRI